MTAFQLSFLILAITPSVVALIAVPASRSRKRLVIALSLAVPVAGPILAVLVSRVRGTGKCHEADEVGESMTANVELEQIRRLGELPSLLELLLSPSSSDRQAALVVLASRADAEAVQILRWVIDHGSPEAVLDAALTLSELDLRFEHDLADAERAYADQPTYQNALVAADVLARAIESGLADPAIATGLAAQARTLYQQAAELPGADRARAHVQLARLELAVGKPRVAVRLLDGVFEQEPAHLTPELARLYERARFAARRPIFLPSPRSRTARTRSGTTLRSVPDAGDREPPDPA